MTNSRRCVAAPRGIIAVRQHKDYGRLTHGNETCLDYRASCRAMSAMPAKANETRDAPVAMAIVDAGGELVACLTTDNLRIFSRR